MLQVADILFYVSIFSVLLPILFLLRSKRNFRNDLIRVLGILLFASAISDFGSYILFRMNISNIPLNNFYIIGQFFLLSYIFYHLLESKRIIYVALILFSGFFIINILFIQPINEFQSWPLSLESVIVLIYSVSYYRQLFKTRIDLLRSYSFWLNTAVFLYFAFDLFLFAMSNYIIKNMSPDEAITAWGFHNLNNIIKNIIFMVAICYVGVKQTEAYDGRDMSKL